MLKLITAIAILLLLVCSSNIQTLAAGGSGPTNIYPNFVNSPLKMSMLKPIDVKLNSDLTKNRINVVFLFDKNFETLRTKVASILTDDLSDYSLFNMEPYKSNKNAFNFWYMDTVVDELKYSVENFLATNNVKFISTVNLKEATINQDEKFTTENGRANADRSIVEYSKDYSTINSYKPGNVRMFYSDKLDFELARVLNHEFGHSILKLNDEYSEPETKLPIYGFPNCAETEAQAKEWWGDLIGTIDPEFYVVREKRIASIIEGEKLNPPEFRTFELIDNKLTRVNYIQDPNNSTKSIRVDNTIVDLNEILNEEDYRVTLTNREGCFAESGIKLSYKPTSKSMMDSYGISYSNVNIREGNKILNLFIANPNLSFTFYSKINSPFITYFYSLHI